jgi:isocitrate dehydrogenase (NAD+)
VPIDPESDGNEDLEYAITSIRRNGVALKGKWDYYCLSIHDLEYSITLGPIAYDINLRFFNLTFFPLSTGNIETRSLSRGVMSRNVALRNELDLFVNVLHCVSYSGVKSRHSDVDVVIVRQNTEGEYAMLEHEVIYCTNCSASPPLFYAFCVFI